MKEKTMKIGEEPIFDVKKLGVSRILILGLQHAFAMFGATVLVPLITGLSVSTTLFMAGAGTLLFHLITKGKVPAFLGSSFAFLGGYAAVAPLIDDKLPNTEMLPYACGGVFMAGLVYVVLSAFIKLFGVKKVMRFFPPVVTGPIIISIGLILAPTAIASCQKNWPLAIIALVVIIICNIWGKGMVKIVPIMLGILISYLAALLMRQVDFTSLKSADFIALPLHMNQFAKFDISAIITIVPIALATMMEHIGDISAIGATTGKNYIEKPGLHRTLLGDGLATSISALFGGPANTTYGENTGVLALTKVYDPLVMQIAAVFAILLSFSPVVSELIRSIPTAIIGGVSLILYGMISAVGIRNIVDNKVDYTNSRNLIISAVILVCALGFSQVGGISFQVFDVTITLSGLAIAALSGIILNAILPGNDYVFQSAETNQL
ncbi:uracil-xanthine permease family protein [Anaeromicropila populeti]|uniref:Uracil permease n=1 Tax=Anaeromicropila populeti TaxID=37658 RepID=A0A1I6JYZ5_9FIRM|nr:uracil-xanthine permease family protein [Anaeromicropila populeti]SFR84196.1 uracil permease [Anaeromicropila populeti]